MRAHTQPHCVLIFESFSITALQVPPHAAQTEHQWPLKKKKIKKNKNTLAETMGDKIKFAALNVTEHHIESLGVTLFISF